MLAKFIKTAAAGTLALGIGISGAYADEHETCGVDLENAVPSGTITGSIKTIGFMVGARWGNGVLTLANGETRTFQMIGAKALETGAAKNDFVGEVYNLKNTDDFEGTYLGSSRNITVGTIGKGEGIANNDKCVVVKVRMSGTGLKTSGPAPGGIEVSFTN